MKHASSIRMVPFAAAVAAAAVSFAVAMPAGAQALNTLVPPKQVVIIVPNAAAGPSDLLARWISPKLSESLKQNVIVDNKPSANGVTAGEFVARAPADGSVLGIGNTGTHAINATFYRKLSYDPVKDFIPVVNVFGAGLVLAANPKLEAKSIKDIIAMSKAKPGSVNVAIAGATGEIATNAIKALAGIDLNNVPYKGGAPAVIAVVSGESHFVLTPWGGVQAQVEAGKMKVLGTTSSRRDPAIPNVPTLAESGLPGFEISMWYGVFAPLRTPTAVINAYNREITRIVNEPELRSQITGQGFEILTGSPEQFAEVVKRDAEKFRKVILDFKMQQDL